MFSQKSSIINVWLGYEYSSESSLSSVIGTIHYDVHSEKRVGGRGFKFVTLMQILSNGSIIYFCGCSGDSQNWPFFADVIKVWPL